MDEVPRLVPDQYDEFVFRRLLDEVYLLMDFISGRPDKRIADLAGLPIPDDEGVAPPADPPADRVIAHICQLPYPPSGYRPLNARNAAFLLLVKDRLNGLAHPALGITIAFTAMVVGSVREPILMADAPPRARPGSRLSLAAEAYPGLVGSAKTLRWISMSAIGLLLLLTMFTAYTSGVAAFGRAMLARIDDVNHARTTQAEAIHRIEATADTGAAKGPVFIRLCQRPGILKTRLHADTDVFDSAVEQQLCDEWSDLDQKQALAYRDLGDYENRYLYLYEWPVLVAGNLHRVLMHPIRSVNAVWHGRTADPEIDGPYTPGDQWVAAVLVNLGNFVLPMCFTLLGAGVSIVRNFYDKVSTSTLAPRDLPLSFGRLALGMMTGAAIGLFYTPTQAAPAGAVGLSGALTFSAQGLAFLAGYGVDSVFEVFDGLLRRIKVGAQPTNSAK